MSYSIETIGTVHSCFKEKFGIPRQPGLVDEARAVLELLPPYNRPDAVRGLDAFSHLWIEFIFHAIEPAKWQPLVRPPRLGGNNKVGVFASRSTHRPNRLGLSVVRLERVECDNGVRLHLAGVDLLDGTPVIDIKPYIPYADAIPSALGGFAPAAPELQLHVLYSDEALESLAQQSLRYPDLPGLIEGVLALDPRPAYRVGGDVDRIYGMRLYDLDVRWMVIETGIEVVALNPVD